MGFFKPNVEKLKVKRNVKGLIKALKDKDRLIGEEAARALGEIKDARAVEPLIQVLEDSDRDNIIREEAARALGEIGDARAVEPLIHSLKDRDSHGIWAAPRALGKIGDARAVEPLIQALKDRDGIIRLDAAEALGEIGDARAVEPLIRALKDGHIITRLDAAEALGSRKIKVREAAAKALGEMGWEPKNDAEKAWYLVAKGDWKELIKMGEPAVEPLIQALKDSDVQEAAVGALGEIGDARAVEPLIQALKDTYISVRHKAAGALGEIGDARAVEPLIQALKDSSVQEAAAGALGKIGEPAVEPLIQALKNSNVQEAATGALGKIGEPAVEPLIQALKDSKVREAAAGALGETGDARAVEPLIRALKDGDSKVREAAAGALGEIGDARAVEPLIQALKDMNFRAPEALNKIGDLRAVEKIIDWLFRSGYPNLENWQERYSWSKQMNNVLGDYTELILSTCRYWSMWIHLPGTDKSYVGRYEYHTEDAVKATGKLCEVRSQISNNILHKVAEKTDIEVVVSVDCFGTNSGTLSFETERDLAKNELERRGNPPYDPSAYMNKEAWKL